MDSPLHQMEQLMKKNIQLIRKDLNDKYGLLRQQIRQFASERMAKCMGSGISSDVCQRRYDRWVHQQEPERSRDNYMQCIGRAEQFGKNVRDKKVQIRYSRACIQKFRVSAVKEVGEAIANKHAFLSQPEDDDI